MSPRPIAWYYTAQFYLGSTRFEEAKAMYQLVIENLPRRFAPVHRELGLVYQGLKQPESAIAVYQKYLEIAPPDAKDRRDIEFQIERLRRNASANK
jgi:tetratricopeptide (TPR) repeat protein